MKVVMSMSDFAVAVAHEIGADSEKVQCTFDRVVAGMKCASAKAM